MGSITAERNEVYVATRTFACAVSATTAIAATAVCSHAPAYGSEYAAGIGSGATATDSANRQQRTNRQRARSCSRKLSFALWINSNNLHSYQF